MPMRYKVIIKTDLADRPKDHELSAALILAQHFKADVVFLRPQLDKTPDVQINGLRWEIKSPRGGGRKTIDNNLRSARKQSPNIVLDLRRAKINHRNAMSRTHHYLISGPHKIKRLKVIAKSRKVIDIL